MLPAGKGGRGKKPGKGGTAEAAAGANTSAEVMDARMLGALITGVRRAHPYVEPKELEGVIEQHAVQLFRTAHIAPFTVAVQALMLLFQVRLCCGLSAVSALSTRTLFFGC